MKPDHDSATKREERHLAIYAPVCLPSPCEEEGEDEEGSDL